MGSHDQSITYSDSNPNPKPKTGINHNHRKTSFNAFHLRDVCIEYKFIY